MKFVFLLLLVVAVASGSYTGRVIAAENKKTPSSYFGSILQQWNYLVLRTKNKDSLSDHATSLLLPTLERNGLKQKLSKALMGDSTTKSSMQFTTAVTGTSLKNAAGMNDNTFFKDITKITTAVTTLQDALTQGVADMTAAGLTLSTDADDVITYLNETLTEAASLIPNATLAQTTLKDQNPGVRDCTSGEVPKSAKSYFDKLFLYANQIYIKAKSILGSAELEAAFDTPVNRNKKKLAFGKQLGYIDSLKFAKICFTYTSTPRKSYYLDDYMDIKNIKTETQLTNALTYLYTAFEQGLVDVNQQFVNRGHYNSDIDQIDVGRLDTSFVDVRSYVENLVNTTETAVGATISNMAGGLDTSGTGGVTGGDIVIAIVSTGTCDTVTTPTDAWEAAMLSEHNDVRTNVFPTSSNMNMMVWSDCLAAVAQAYLDSCPGFNHNGDRSTEAQAANCTTSSVGENLYMTSVTSAAADATLAASVVGAWAAEVSDYTFASDSCSAVCGHYTQVAWADSTAVGCAMANDCSSVPDSGTIVLCNYDPAGNFNSQSPYTAGTSCSGCSGVCENNLCCPIS